MQKIRKLKKNKKGDATDIIVFLLITVFLAISFIVVIFVNNIIKEDVIEGTALGETSSATAILESYDVINTESTQRGFVLFISLLMIGVFISAFLVRLHPAFMFIYILILGFTIFMAAVLGNLYESFTSAEALAATAASQPMINFIMNNIVKIVVIVDLLSMIIVFAKLNNLFTSPGGDF